MGKVRCVFDYCVCVEILFLFLSGRVSVCLWLRVYFVVVLCCILEIFRYWRFIYDWFYIALLFAKFFGF